MAFIVPYRDRAAHLGKFIPHYLTRFKDLKIFVIEQGDTKPFNRGKLINAGFTYFQDQFDYFAAHDVDMLATKADYSPPTVPTQLATKVQQFNYKMPFPQYFGGVTLFRNDQFALIGGFSNEFWGYGAEDEEMYNNVKIHGLPIHYRTCFFQSLHHQRKIDKELHQRNCRLRDEGRGPGDGLNNCKFNAVKLVDYPGYKKLIVTL